MHNDQKIEKNDNLSMNHEHEANENPITRINHLLHDLNERSVGVQSLSCQCHSCKRRQD